jgi:hypothetical protein
VRRAILALVVLLLVIGAVVYVVGSTECPPPGWAFWRYAGEGRTNFACVA